MLDTRKIEMFTKPQSIIDRLNPMLFERTFSDWSSSSSNFIVSDLLWEHVMNVVTNKDNFQKLCDTCNKIGLKKGMQMMYMGSQRVLVMTEAIEERTVRMSVSGLNPDDGLIFVCSADVELFPSDGAWYRSFNPIVADRYQKLDTKKLTEFCQDLISRAASTYIYLTLIEVETVYVEPREKFRPKKYEGFKNQQKVRLQVADLSWSKETIINLPFGVSGHLRQQPVGPGRQERKLIYIEPFKKTGYVRKSGKERILKQV